MVAGTKVTLAQLLPIKGGAAQIAAAVLRGMQQAADAAFVLVEEAEVLTAVDHLVALRLVLTSSNRSSEGGEVLRTVHLAPE